MNETNLTEQEGKIAALAGKGLSNKEIAGQVGITEKTVKFHLTRVFKKLNVGNRKQLIAVFGPLGRKLGTVMTPEDVATDLLMEVVLLAKSGRGYSDKLQTLGEALKNAPSIRHAVVASLTSVDPTKPLDAVLRQ